MNVFDNESNIQTKKNIVIPKQVKIRLIIECLQ